MRTLARSTYMLWSAATWVQARVRMHASAQMPNVYTDFLYRDAFKVTQSVLYVYHPCACTDTCVEACMHASEELSLQYA